MLRLRPYKKCDAKDIVSWCRDERTFLQWGGEHFGKYPITESAVNDKYLNENGGCTEEDNFYPMTAFDESGTVGHFIIRYLNGDNRILRFGWVIVDDSRRGKGYGKEMLSLGMRYVFDIMKAERLTIGVFENNTPAYRCYLSAGFRRTGDSADHYENVQGEQWKVVELEITADEYRGRN